jgi:hypothetical protein
MWLDQAEEFFAIRFSAQRRLSKLVRRFLGRS